MDITMIPDIMTTLFMTTTTDGIFTEPKYFEFSTINMSSIGLVFTSIGNFCTYIVTSPYYLYKSIHTKYVNYQKNEWREFYAWRNYREDYNQELERLAKYEAFVEASAFSFEEIDKTTEHAIDYYKAMQLIIESSIKQLENRVLELQGIPISYLHTKRDMIVEHFKQRIELHKTYHLREITEFLQSKKDSQILKLDTQKSFYADAFQRFKFEQEDLRAAERLTYQQELDKLAKQAVTLQSDNKQLSRVNQRMIDNATAFEEDAKRYQAQIVVLEAAYALSQQKLKIAERNSLSAIKDQDPLIRDVAKYKEILVNLDIELRNRDKTIQELSLRKNQLLAENEQHKKDMLVNLGIELRAKDETIRELSLRKNQLLAENEQHKKNIEEQSKQYHTEKIKLLAKVKAESATSKQTYEAYTAKIEELEILQKQHDLTNKTLKELRTKNSKLEEIINSPKYRATDTIIGSHIALNRVFKQLKDKQSKLEMLNAEMFFKWKQINKNQEELVNNKSTNKDTLESIKRYKNEVSKYSILLDMPNLKDSERQSYQAEIKGASTNIRYREELLQSYYNRQEELKLGIQSDYQHINNLLKEFNILCLDIAKHNKDFEDEMMRNFPEFFKLDHRSSDIDTTTTTSTSLSSTSPTVEYPLSRSSSNPDLHDKLTSTFREKEVSQRRNSDELDRPKSADSTTPRDPLISDDALAKYHLMSLQFQPRKVSESNTQTLPSRKLSNKELESIKNRFQQVDDSNGTPSRPQIAIHKTNPQIRNVARSIDPSSNVELITTTPMVNSSNDRNDTNTLSVD